MAGAGEPWWIPAFGPDYLAVYAHRDDAAAAAEVAGLLPRLRAAQERCAAPLLDAGCGAGRHLEAFRAAGLSALGFDFSPHLLTVATGREACARRLARADMRQPPFAPGAFAAITLLFTAFGYFDDPGNARCLATLARLLAPGGVLVLDLPDPAHLAAGLVPSSERRLADGTQVRERRHLVEGRVDKTVELWRDGRQVGGWQESVRLYERSEVAALAAGAGLELAATWSSLRSASAADGRLVGWLHRPASAVASP